MNDWDAAEDDQHFWDIRIIDAPTHGYIVEVFHEQIISFELTDAELSAIEGQWMRSSSYRTMTAYATLEQAREAGERLRQFFNFLHFRR